MLDKKRFVYLACPYSGTPEQVSARMTQFCRAVGRMQVAGEFIVSPLFMHYVLEHRPELGTHWEFWKNYSEELMRRCDEFRVLRLEGWDRSTGIEAETQLAQTLGMPISFADPV